MKNEIKTESAPAQSGFSEVMEGERNLDRIAGVEHEMTEQECRPITGRARELARQYLSAQAQAGEWIVQIMPDNDLVVRTNRQNGDPETVIADVVNREIGNAILLASAPALLAERDRLRVALANCVQWLAKAELDGK